MRTNEIEIELMEIEAQLDDGRLSEDCRQALHGAAQALRWVLEPDEWATPTQTFYPLARRPLEPVSRAVH